MSAHKPTREEIALTEVGHTDIGRGTAIAMVVVFLLLIVTVPVIDTVAQWRADEPITALGVLRAPPRFSDFPRPVQRGETHGHNPLHAFESSLEQASAARGAVQRQVELALASTMHAGSGKVIRGEGDWLFWRPGVDAVAGRGFLTPEHQAVTPRRHRDPRPSIAAVHAACTAAGARLVVLALPDKATIHADRISRAFAPGAAPRNPDDDAFAAWLDDQGIARIDALPVLLAHAATGEAFLRQDTHWTPEAMDAVAALVAARVRELAGDLPAVTWREETAEVARVGDLVDALKLPSDQGLFAAQHVRIGRVLGDAGPWDSDPAAAVLLLGDSFANIYSAAPMGWGKHAGFAARLALRGRCAVDAIAINGGGASGALKVLAKRPAPLGGKRVVVWEFAARDLAVEEWPVIALRSAPADATLSATPPVAAAGDLEVIAELLTAMPSLAGFDGGQYTHARAVLNFKVHQVVRGTWTAPEVLVTLPVVEASKRTRSADLQPGRRYRMVLTAKIPAVWAGMKVFDSLESEETPLWTAEAVPAF